MHKHKPYSSRAILHVEIDGCCPAALRREQEVVYGLPGEAQKSYSRLNAGIAPHQPATSPKSLVNTIRTLRRV